MKNLIKYAFAVAVFLAAACNNAPTEQSEKVVSASTNTTAPKVMAKASPSSETAVEEIELVKVKKIEKEVPRPDATKTITHPKTKETAKAVEVVKATPKTMAEEPAPKAPTISEVQKALVKTEKEKMTKTAEAPIKETIPAKEKVVTLPKEKEATTSKEEMATTEAESAPKTMDKKSSPPPFTHDAWDKLAQKHISSTGKVNYKGFKADIATFDAYLKSLANNPVQSDWSRAKKMAYWINAYNAFTIKLIVDNYPVQSITNLDGGKPWDKKWIKLGDKTYSLNNIEHDILRPKYKDARIHFAVNCAAKSCPPVWNRAWTAQNLNSQLERSAKSFINNEKYNSIGKNEVSISKIFEWYAVDFGDITDYLNKFSTTDVAEGATVKYKDYNWALNE